MSAAFTTFTAIVRRLSKLCADLSDVVPSQLKLWGCLAAATVTTRAFHWYLSTCSLGASSANSSMMMVSWFANEGFKRSG